VGKEEVEDSRRIARGKGSCRGSYSYRGRSYKG